LYKKNLPTLKVIMKFEIRDFILILFVGILLVVLIPKFSFATELSPAPAPHPVAAGRRCNNPIPVDQQCETGTFVTSYSDDGSTKVCCRSI
jgi:hypothetical protein